MAVSTRSGAMLLAVVAFSLSVTGVVLAATDSSSTGPAKDPLALNGYPPKSANLLVTVSTGQAYSLSANVHVDFSTNNVEATLNFPLMFSVAAVDLRLVGQHLYAGSAVGSSGPWLMIPMKQPALFGLALEMTRPDIGLIGGFGQETITKSGYTTTYNFIRDDVAVTNGLVSANQSVRLGTLNWSVSTGAQGEVTQSTATITSRHSMTKISAVVLSFNHGGPITAPRRIDVRPVPRSTIQQLLGSAAFTSILFPQHLSSLGQTVLK